MDSAKNKNYIKVTPHKSIYIYIYIGKKKKSKMCNRIKKSAKQDVQDK